jgi:hypothetical protein
VNPTETLIGKWIRTVEASLICDIVHEKYSHGAPVIRSSNGPKTFLSRGIPYLKLDSLAVQLDCPYFEINANRCDE